HFSRRNLTLRKRSGQAFRFGERELRRALDVGKLKTAAQEPPPILGRQHPSRAATDHAPPVDLGIPEKQSRVQKNRGADVAVPSGRVQRPEGAGAQSDGRELLESITGAKGLHRLLDLVDERLPIKRGDIEANFTF